MKTNKLLSYITLGVLFSGVAFADGGDFILMDGAETQSPAAIAGGDASTKEVVVTGSQREYNLADTDKSSDVSDAGDGIEYMQLRSTDQGTADGDLTRVQDSDRKVTKDRKRLLALEAEDNSKDSQDRASPQEIIVTGSN